MASETVATRGRFGKTVDLAFAMDCTGSMASYIENARQVCAQWSLINMQVQQVVLSSYFN
jgi:hypothetical protein